MIMRVGMLLMCLAGCVVPVAIPVQGETVSRTQRSLAADPIHNGAFDQALNAARRANGLRPLVPNNALVAAALGHARDMKVRNYFSHQSPEGIRAAQRVARVGVPACGAGENIAMGQTSTQEVFASWMSSRGHRANMLNPRMQSYGLARAGKHWVLVLYAPC